MTIEWRLGRLFRSASVKFASLYVLMFAASALVLGVAVFFVTRSALEQQLTSRIETETNFLVGEFHLGGLDRLITVARARGHGPTALDYLIQDASGAHLVGEMPAQPGLRPGWATINVADAVEDGGGPEWVRALVTDVGDGILLAVGDDLAQIGEVEKAIGTAFAWVVGLTLLLGMGGGALLSRAFLKRVDAIGSAAEAIIGGDLARRIPVRGTGDDLDRLAVTLNRMLDRISGLMDSLRQVSSDVAHDLRTPLSRLYLGLEDAREHARTAADYDSAVVAALAEAEGLLATFSALLRIAQVEGASAQDGFGRVDLSGLAEAVADAYRPDAEESGHRLDTRLSPDITVGGDKELLTQALSNLVENALRHTPSGTAIRLSVADTPDGPRLAIEDDGPGVSPGDLPRLTDRFYRGERSRTTPGNGLGLSLVNAVAERHLADLHLERTEPGLRVSIVFRCGPPTPPKRKTSA